MQMMKLLRINIFASVSLWVLCGAESMRLFSPPEHLLGEEDLENVGVPTVESHGSYLTMIEEFVRRFAHKVLSKNSSVIYDTTLPRDEAKTAFEKITFTVVDNVHTRYPREEARTVSTAIGETFGNLTTPKLIKAYGFAAASYLAYKKVLNHENLDKLTDRFVFYVEQAACNVPNIRDPRDAYIQASIESIAHFMSSLNLFSGSSVVHIVHDFALALHHLTGVSVPPPEIPCNNGNVLRKFISKFTHAILASRSMSQIFVTSLPPKRAADAYYRILRNALANFLIPYLDSVTKITSNAIEKTFGELTLPQHVLTNGYSVGEYLKYYKVLTCDTLNELVDGYVFFVRQSVRNVPQIPERRLAYIQAISDSYVHILVSANVYTNQSAFHLAYTYSSALYYLTGVSPDDALFDKVGETVRTGSFVDD